MTNEIPESLAWPNERLPDIQSPSPGEARNTSFRLGARACYNYGQSLTLSITSRAGIAHQAVDVVGSYGYLLQNKEYAQAYAQSGYTDSQRMFVALPMFRVSATVLRTE